MSGVADAKTEMEEELEKILLEIISHHPKTKDDFNDARRKICGKMKTRQPSNMKLFTAYQNLLKKKSSYLKNRPLPMEQRNKLIKDLFREAEVAEKQDDGVLAEAKYLDIINFDQKNLRAFFFLGELYYSNAKLTEAIQTLSFALKLAVKEKRLGILAEDLSVAEIYFSLAKAGLELERLDYALESIREALDLEPNNPRYLDLILDLSIMKKDKGLAWTYFNKMSAINPENNKLQTWREEIMALGEDN